MDKRIIVGTCRKQLKRKEGPCGDVGDNIGGKMLPRVESGAKSEGGVGSLLEHSDVIAENVVRFLGVRSLVSFSATSKSHRVAMEEEVERRKRRIAATEVEVARLMAAQQQTATLSAYINKKLDVFYSSFHLEPEDQTSRYELGDCGLCERDFNEVKDLHSHVKKENVGGEVPFSHLSRMVSLRQKYSLTMP